MKKTILLNLLMLIVIMSYGQSGFYDFVVKDIEGKDFKLSSLKGKKVLVVNTASKCGLTPQYKQLEELYKTYGGEQFVIIGFPANNFANQEPGSNEDIMEFCEKNYGVTFPMMEKVSVKGDDICPLYQWLTQKSKNGKMDSKVSWNFQKYLIDEEGNLVDVVEPKVKPDDVRIVGWLRN
ncbi:glutathione peroxidase [Maribellus luteus]|uniref:Glutathione peroxidase n=1 Tax=Maribellus luteus TaxID=2305463 RepID=A0A399SUQ6_9BACT|nr:glutathione peroxidase [Maribellus luteus]RIJ47740.1 glutathione peroxidase [Maribellus luteus]